MGATTTREAPIRRERPFGRGLGAEPNVADRRQQPQTDLFSGPSPPGNPPARYPNERSPGVPVATPGFMDGSMRSEGGEGAPTVGSD
ncbi:hypothetical protein T484DRAFT_1903569, partial [Baffinella frigidus]